MFELHNDKSEVKPEETKSFSEGAGQFMSALGKEIDEHDVGGKLANAKAFAIKANAISSYLVIGAVLIGTIAVTVIFPLIFGTSDTVSKSVEYVTDNKRIVTEDGVKQYQMKVSDEWYMVSEDIFNNYGE